MQAPELRASPVHIVLALPQVEVHDVDGVYLLDIAVVLAELHVLCNDL